MRQPNFDIDFIGFCHNVPRANGPIRLELLKRGINPNVKTIGRIRFAPPPTETELQMLPQDIRDKLNFNSLHFIVNSYFDIPKERLYY